MNSGYSSFSKEKRFKDFIGAVQFCTLCDRLCNRTKVLSENNGNINSKILFIAEAPGRLGADKTGIPLYGDKTGDNFELFLSNIGWVRKDIFVTNAILCNPRTENGNNGTPTAEEIKNCNIYLEMTINLIKPDVIVTLGTVALDALAKISPHKVKLKENVGETIPWMGKVLIPFYHPAPRALIHRSLAKQRADYIKLAKFVHPVRGILDKTRKSFNKDLDINNALSQTIVTIIKSIGEVSYFKLTKLLYFIDLFSLEQLGRSLTGSIYLRQQEGPWLPELPKVINRINGYEVLFRKRNNMPIVYPGPCQRLKIDLSDEELNVIVEVLEKYGNMSNKSIKIAAYRTKPMKYILAQEKNGRDMRKIPIIYKNKTVILNEKGQNDD